MTGGIRLSPPAGRAGGGLPEIVSVRPGHEELRGIQALNVIFATTPSGVIRQACGFFLSHAGRSACSPQRHAPLPPGRRGLPPGRQRGGRPL